MSVPMPARSSPNCSATTSVLFTNAAHAQLKGAVDKAIANKTSVATVVRLVDDGADFQLICRGGPGLRIAISEPYVAGTKGSFVGGVGLATVSTMTVDFGRSNQLPDRSGRNLKPGQCSPADFLLRDGDATQVRVAISVHDPWDKSADAAETIPSTGTIPRYLKDPHHFWSFAARDSGNGYLQAADSRYWKPQFYTGPATSTTHQDVGAAAAPTHNPATKTQITASRYGGARTRTEGHAGAPTPHDPPSPAVPAPSPPVVVEPDPVLPVTFRPPLLEDNAQLWACVDAATAEAEAGACSGTDSAQAYCQLRNADRGPAVLIADAQAGIPVRSVNGDICPHEAACRIVSELQCDH